LQYYLYIEPITSGYAASYLGDDGTGTNSVNYTATTVQDHPFKFPLAFADQIALGLPVQDAYGNVQFDIEGNDTVYPVTNFLVRSAPSLLTTNEWFTNTIVEKTLDRDAGTGHFIVEPDPALTNGSTFYRLDLLWP
jgi:hypothetical protein